MILIGVSAFLVFCVFMMFRDWRVYDYTTKMLWLAHDQAGEEINRYQFDTWRSWYEEADRGDYNQMMIQFWRSLSSFYKGTRLYELDKQRKELVG